MRIILVENEEIVSAVKSALKKNGGYCPCKLKKTPESKCMCQEFRETVAEGIEGKCKCGLYLAINDKKEKYDKV